MTTSTDFQQSDNWLLFQAIAGSGGSIDPLGLAKETKQDDEIAELVVVKNFLDNIDSRIQNSNGATSVFKDPATDLSWFQRIHGDMYDAVNSHSVFKKADGTGVFIHPATFLSVVEYAKESYQMAVNLLNSTRNQYSTTILIQNATLAGLQTAINTELSTNHPSYNLVSCNIFPNATDTLFTAVLIISAYP